MWVLARVLKRRGGIISASGRGRPGVSLSEKSFEIFAEIAPVLILTRDLEGDLDGAIGLPVLFPMRPVRPEPSALSLARNDSVRFAFEGGL